MAALPYMQLYVADYLADTAHLSTLEHGAYLLLMFNYWQRGESFKAKDEQSLNKRLASVARMSVEEWENTKEHLAEFFEISETEWRHFRIDRDLEAVNAKSTKARAAGKASAASRSNARSTNAEKTLSHTDTDTDTDTDKLHGACAPVASQADDHAEPAPKPALQCPTQKIVDAYHELMPDNPRVRVLDEARNRTISARWREAARNKIGPFGYDNQAAGLEAWKKFFSVCNDSDFLTGKTAPGFGRTKPFIADLDFLMSPKGFKGCLENKYHRDE